MQQHLLPPASANRAPNGGKNLIKSLLLFSTFRFLLRHHRHQTLPLPTPPPDVSALINEQQECLQQTQRMPRRRFTVCASFSLNAGEPNWAGAAGEKV